MIPKALASSRAVCSPCTELARSCPAGGERELGLIRARDLETFEKRQILKASQRFSRVVNRYFAWLLTAFRLRLLGRTVCLSGAAVVERKRRSWRDTGNLELMCEVNSV
ncbi:hypothetical protein MHYP_G00050980 [Metynnis hypsauchen]